jgi:hypothetical protein
MSIKLAILKSGETLIADIKEGVVEDKVVAYLLNKPCLVVINGTFGINLETDGNKKVSLSLSPWPYLSVDETVTVVVDWIVTIVEPNPELKLMYETQILGKEDEQNGKQNTEVANFTEQSDTDNSD